MILLYDPKKVYDPNDLKHRMRRAMKQQIERRYVEGRMTNKVLKWLLNLPIVRQTIAYMNKKMLEGTNIPTMEEILKTEEQLKEKVR